MPHVGNYWKNIHTGSVALIAKVDVIESNPGPITVYQFTDGDRWEEKQLLEHWRPVTWDANLPLDNSG